jgi:hypothetical protein
VVGLCVAVLYAFKSRSALIRLGGPVEFEDEHTYDVLNPFRDRSPEQPAIAILKEVQAGHCAEMAKRFGVQNDPTCARDTELHILSWSLRAREDLNSGEAMLLFQVKRDLGNQRTGYTPYWFHVKKQANNSWNVVQLERLF